MPLVYKHARHNQEDHGKWARQSGQQDPEPPNLWRKYSRKDMTEIPVVTLTGMPISPSNRKKVKLALSDASELLKNADRTLAKEYWLRFLMYSKAVARVRPWPTTYRWQGDWKRFMRAHWFAMRAAHDYARKIEDYELADEINRASRDYKKLALEFSSQSTQISEWTETMPSVPSSLSTETINKGNPTPNSVHVDTIMPGKKRKYERWKSQQLLGKGDCPGHPFRGNQHTGGKPGLGGCGKPGGKGSSGEQKDKALAAPVRKVPKGFKLYHTAYDFRLDEHEGRGKMVASRNGESGPGVYTTDDTEFSARMERSDPGKRKTLVLETTKPLRLLDRSTSEGEKEYRRLQLESRLSGSGGNYVQDAGYDGVFYPGATGKEPELVIANPDVIRIVERVSFSKGDCPGHPFRGNQHTKGKPGLGGCSDLGGGLGVRRPTGVVRQSNTTRSSTNPLTPEARANLAKVGQPVSDEELAKARQTLVDQYNSMRRATKEDKDKHCGSKSSTDRPGGDRRPSSKARAKRRETVLAKFGDGHTAPCGYCGIRLDFKTVELEKLDPVMGYNIIENLAPACRGCNESLSDLDPAVKTGVDFKRPFTDPRC